MGKLMVSISGVRGIVGDSFTPDVVRTYVAAFASSCGPGPIVVGRDSRPSGEALKEIILDTLTATGRDVIDFGIVTTPTVQLMVEEEHAAGGIALTASHNPVEWNALKFIGATGRFLNAEEGQPVLKAAEKNSFFPSVTRGHVVTKNNGHERHVARVLQMPYLDVSALRARKFKVVVDALHGAAGPLARLLLEALGCKMTILGEAPTGEFSRKPEPLPANIVGLCAAVQEEGVDAGFALDPDGDRLALVDEFGQALGEDVTLALGVQAVVSQQPGAVVTNLSTSAKVAAAAAKAGSEFFRTPVGEANVVAGMLEHQAVVGGEGGGGVIVPAVHYGRDAAVAMALTLAVMQQTGRSLSQLADDLPHLTLVKDKVEGAHTLDFATLRSALENVLPGGTEDVRDGWWYGVGQQWIHVRPSNTEPIIRIYAEAESPELAQDLVNVARSALV
jgi:phosphomannomutase